MSDEAPVPTAAPSMTRLYIREPYSYKIYEITLVSDATQVNALIALIERSGAKVKAIDVPIRPNIKEEE